MERLTTRQAAARLGVSEGHVRNLVKAGLLVPVERYPRLLLFDAEELGRYAAERRPAGNPDWRKADDATPGDP